MLVSLFDLDKTLFKVNSSFQFGVYLYRRRIIPVRKMIYLSGCYLYHRMGWMEMSALHERSLKSFFMGCPVTSLQTWVEQFLCHCFDRMLNLSMAEILREAVSKGHFTAILSSSPAFLVEPIAKKMGVKEYLATDYEITSGGRIGLMRQCVRGEEKMNYVQQLAARLGISTAHMTAYSDSHLDLPFLESVGRPVAVNPTNKLRVIAQRQGWEILDEKKFPDTK